MPNIPFVGKHFTVDEDFFDFLYRAYGEGLTEQFQSMDAWLEANPRRRKKNVKRFVVNWLNKEAAAYARELRRERATKKELRVGAGPQAYECQVCQRRLVAAFLPASCPRCGAVKSWITR